MNGSLDGVLNVAGEELLRAEVGVAGDGPLELILLAMSGVGNHFISDAFRRRDRLHVKHQVGVGQTAPIFVDDLDGIGINRIAVYL